METEYRLFVGIDWGGEAHQVCVLDPDRRKVGERSIRHDGEGIAELVNWLSAMVAGAPATIHGVCNQSEAGRPFSRSVHSEWRKG